jgi:hypothetical protein
MSQKSVAYAVKIRLIKQKPLEYSMALKTSGFLITYLEVSVT